MTHQQQLQRCLTDTTLPVDLRCAAILVLLYGQMTGRLVTLTFDRLTNEDDKTFLCIGKQVFRLPPRVADLFRSLRQQCIPSVIGRAADTANIWLFPGHQPGKHHGAAAMTRRLRQAGFEPATARLTALIDMTDDLPSPIAADLLGYDVQTTDKFAKITQHDWAPYLHERGL